VLGSGVDRPWPAVPLTDAICERGLLLSEFHPGEAPRPHHFPLRNRVISGLARGVLVIEAAHASGSLITARWAVDQGRSVWALPGRVDQPMSRGTHRLIREGALLVESPDEIIEELFGARPSVDGEAAAPARVPDPPSVSAVLETLRGETSTVDEIVQRSGKEVSEVLVALIELELSGRVVRAPGGVYRLVVS
jgi:DNA processing protein